MAKHEKTKYILTIRCCNEYGANLQKTTFKEKELAVKEFNRFLFNTCRDCKDAKKILKQPFTSALLHYSFYYIGGPIPSFDKIYNSGEYDTFIERLYKNIKSEIEMHNSIKRMFHISFNEYSLYFIDDECHRYIAEIKEICKNHT